MKRLNVPLFEIAAIGLALATATCGAGSAVMPTQGAQSASGEQLFRSSGCDDCHGSGRGVVAPALEDLYGKEVLLEGGMAVIADEAYLRESILSPGAQTVAGYKPIMPAFQGRFSETELDDLVAYVRSLSG